MKLRCPGCQKVLNVADAAAGKAVRCPGCNRAVRVPQKAAEPAVAATRGVRSTVDLDSLAQLESRSAQLGQEELAAVQSELAAKRAATAAPTSRVCPKCKKETPVKDPRVEVLCSHCWEPIPGIASDDAYDTGGARLVGHHGGGAEGTTRFYDGLASALAYPGPAIGSILLVVVIAMGSIFLPVGLMTAMAAATAQSEVGKEGITSVEADLSSVQLVLKLIFGAQIFAFACIGLNAFFDAVRTTAVGEESPPSLSWNPNSWGRSVIAVVALAIYYGAMTYFLLFFLAGPDTASSMLSGAWITDEDFSFGFITPGFIVGMVVISFLTPMNLIGMSLGSIAQGLHPGRVLKSVGKTHVHYLFLVILLCVYGALGSGAFAVILEWFIPRVQAAAAGAGKGAMGKLGVGLVGWGAVMGFVFYLNLVLGRIHGLFARTYRKELAFGEA